MRIDYITLPAFGMFTGKTLRFAEGKGIHLIYGPNEAGKSTLLQAIGDGLFGIPGQTAHAFLHKPSQLRIELGLQLADGTKLAFRRRKGVKNTLLDLDDKALPEEILEPFLGGLGRGDFEDMFGLDHLRLRDGGRRLLESGGDLGQSLFEAASGMRYLQEVFGGLDKEASELYTHRSRSRLVPSLASEYREKRRAASQAALLVGDFQELEQRYQQQREELQRVAEQVKEKRERSTALSRIKRTKPLLVQRQDLLDKLEALGPVPSLPPGSGDLYEELADALRAAELGQEEAQSQADALQEELAGLTVPQGLLEQAAVVEELYQGLEKYAEAVDALPELEQKTQLAEESALRKLQEIRPHATRLEEAEHYRLPLMASAAVERLAEEYGQIRLDRETAGAAVQSRLADLEKAKRSLEKLGPMLDTGSLQRLVNRIRAHGALEKQHHDKLLEIAQLEESLSSQLERLPLWERPLEELASAQLPLEVTVEGCIQTERELDEKLARVKQEMEALEKQAGELRRQIGLLRTTGAVPSEKDLALARARRDHGWKLVRKAWLDKQPDVAGELEFSPDRPLPEAYEDSVTQADRISDELRRESDRVATIQALESQLGEVEGALEEKGKAEQALHEERQAFYDAWKGIWQPVQVVPLQPQAMGEWLERAQSLVQGYEELKQARVAAEALREQIGQLQGELAKALGAFVEPPRGSLGELLELAGEICEEAAERRGEHRRLTEVVEEQQDVLEKEQARLKAAQEAEQDWGRRWAEAMEAVGLPNSTDAPSALRYLRALDELFKLIDDLGVHKATRERQRKYITEYQRKVEAVVGKVGIEVYVESVPRAVRELMDGVKAAQAMLVRKEGLAAQIQGLQLRLGDLKRQAARSEEGISELMAAAECNTTEELIDILARHKQGEELREKIANLEEQLASEGFPLPQLMAEAQSMHMDRIPGELLTLQEELERLEAEQQDLNRAFGVTEKEYEEKVAGTSAQGALAAEQAQDTLARLAGAVDKYLKLKLSSLVLKRAVERYREEHQDPVLKRAGDIFAGLTGGSFTHLVVDYDAQDNPVIKGARNDELVGVEGMSDGTQDQLYLALRLASIERYLDHKEPIPFVVDDVLINFDDTRSAAALKALADLSQKTQVIMFTHHGSIVQMAAEVLPKESLALYILGRGEAAEILSGEALELAQG